MDGLEASTKILEVTKDEPDYCRIVALTSYTDSKTREKATLIGMKDLINKPMQVKDLQRMIYLHFYRRSETKVRAQFPHLFEWKHDNITYYSWS